MHPQYGTDDTYVRSFSAAQTLFGVGNSVYRISNTRIHPRTRTILYAQKGGSVFVRIDVGGHYHIARSPIVGIRRRICIGFAFGYESGSPHFVLRRWMAGAFSLSCVRWTEGLKASPFAKEGRGRSPPRWETAGFNRGALSDGSMRDR